eukprot:TRINITY_DN26075_c0_g1_i1.p1 TRINITY_DN26075_c0_g1~~TRINITY_DN26075_c0_g1_i1.p1  ORF type:complete len:669 (-),score=198.41 TRINITY_DN26075_c0_g1_i1:67-2073(-)
MFFRRTKTDKDKATKLKEKDKEKEREKEKEKDREPPAQLQRETSLFSPRGLKGNNNNHDVKQNESATTTNTSKPDEFKLKKQKSKTIDGNMNANVLLAGWKGGEGQEQPGVTRRPSRIKDLFAEDTNLESSHAGHAAETTVAKGLGDLTSPRGGAPEREKASRIFFGRGSKAEVTQNVTKTNSNLAKSTDSENLSDLSNGTIVKGKTMRTSNWAAVQDKLRVLLDVNDTESRDTSYHKVWDFTGVMQLSVLLNEIDTKLGTEMNEPINLKETQTGNGGFRPSVIEGTSDVNSTEVVLESCTQYFDRVDKVMMRYFQWCERNIYNAMEYAKYNEMKSKGRQLSEDDYCSEYVTRLERQMEKIRGYRRGIKGDPVFPGIDVSWRFQKPEEVDEKEDSSRHKPNGNQKSVLAASSPSKHARTKTVNVTLASAGTQTPSPKTARATTKNPEKSGRRWSFGEGDESEKGGKPEGTVAALTRQKILDKISQPKVPKESLQELIKNTRQKKLEELAKTDASKSASNFDSDEEDSTGEGVTSPIQSKSDITSPTKESSDIFDRTSNDREARRKLYEERRRKRREKLEKKEELAITSPVAEDSYIIVDDRSRNIPVNNKREEEEEDEQISDESDGTIIVDDSGEEIVEDIDTNVQVNNNKNQIEEIDESSSDEIIED